MIEFAGGIRDIVDLASVVMMALCACGSLFAFGMATRAVFLGYRMGRPVPPKGEAKGRIVPIRFNAADIKRIVLLGLN